MKYETHVIVQLGPKTFQILVFKTDINGVHTYEPMEHSRLRDYGEAAQALRIAKARYRQRKHFNRTLGVNFV